ncbi:MAG: PspC domain-containing protein [Sphingobacteriaceae bacterium]|nr:MAG: PspC domain-containing protein [Sphingobacteriaceae bacterium]
MNKTIIININGFIFHIEEDAYEILKNYMTDVKRHFLNSADSLEITTDIENRIAEMFTEILATENKQVIIEQDVIGVVEQMGSVADFENPEEQPKGPVYSNYTGKRKLFRDSERHLLGGVCSGLANYFDTQVIWMRLAFLAGIPLFGIGIILYLLFWLIIPRATSRTHRMAMRGQQLNLQGFKENLAEEHHPHYKPGIYKVRDFWGSLFRHIGAFISTIAKVLIKLIGVGVILASVGFIVFLIVAIVCVSFGEFRPFDGLPYQVLQHTYTNQIFISGFLTGAIPALAIIFLTLKGIFNTGSVNKQWASGLFIVWLCAISIFIYCCVKIAAHFSDDATFSETITLNSTPSNVYVLKLNDNKFFSAEDSVRLNIKALKPNTRVVESPFEYNNYHHYRYNKVYISIERSDISQPVLVKSYHSQGRDYDEALSNARNIKYRFLQKDSVLSFDYKLYDDEELWHDETLHLTLKLPLNAKVTIDTKLKNFIVNNDINACEETNKLPDGIPATFIMTENGLQCIIDPVIAKARKRDQRLLDSLRSIDDETGEQFDQESEQARERSRQRRYHMIDSLEGELR